MSEAQNRIGLARTHSVVTAAVAVTPTTIRSPASVVTATATVTAIIPPNAIRVSAPIHAIPTPIPATGPAVILVTEQPIASFASGDLIANEFRGDAPLSEILSVPFYLTRQIRQLRRTKALPHALRHDRCAVFRGDHGFLDHRQAFRANSQRVRTHSLPLALSASR